MLPLLSHSGQPGRVDVKALTVSIADALLVSLLALQQLLLRLRQLLPQLLCGCEGPLLHFQLL